MKKLVDLINAIEFAPKGQKLLDALERSYEVIASHSSPDQHPALRQTIDHLKGGGKYIIHHVFAGGIIFLREPETILRAEMRISPSLNSFSATVEYASEVRNARNVKAKPDVGKFEQTECKLVGVFPSFELLDRSILIGLLAVIGKNAQITCEHTNRTSWFMKYEKDFPLELFLEDELLLTYPVKSHPESLSNPGPE